MKPAHNIVVLAISLAGFAEGYLVEGAGFGLVTAAFAAAFTAAVLDAWERMRR